MQRKSRRGDVKFKVCCDSSQICCTHSFSFQTELTKESIQEKFDTLVVGKFVFSLLLVFSPHSFRFPPFPLEYMAAIGAEMLQELYLIPIFLGPKLEK